MDIVENRGEGQLHVAPARADAPLEGRPRLQRRLHLRPLRQQRARHRQQHASASCMFDPYDIEKDRGPDPNVVKHRVVVNGTWDLPVGHGRKYGANMPGWANALFGGWTVSTLFQARSGLNLTPFFSGFYSTSPWNTGKPLDGLGNFFCCAWRPDQIKDPNTGRLARRVLRRDRLRPARAGHSSATRRRAACGARAPGWSNFAFYKDVVATRALPAAALGAARQRLQPPAVLPRLRLAASCNLDSYLVGRRRRTTARRPCWGRAPSDNVEGLLAGEGVPHRLDERRSSARPRGVVPARAGATPLSFPASGPMTELPSRRGSTTRPSSRSCSPGLRAADVAFARTLTDDVLVLGAGGKMGPSLARRVRRAFDAAGVQRRVVAVSRFSEPGIGRRPRAGRDRGRLLRPARPGRGRAAARASATSSTWPAGSSDRRDRPDLTWAHNTIVPALRGPALRRRRASSSSRAATCIRSCRASSSRRHGGRTRPAPVGEYAQSCLGRERVFEYFSRERGTPCLLFRLFYAVDLRYGTLVDIARARPRRRAGGPRASAA